MQAKLMIIKSPAAGGEQQFHARPDSQDESYPGKSCGSGAGPEGRTVEPLRSLPRQKPGDALPGSFPQTAFLVSNTELNNTWQSQV